MASSEAPPASGAMDVASEPVVTESVVSSTRQPTPDVCSDRVKALHASLTDPTHAALERVTADLEKEGGGPALLESIRGTESRCMRLQREEAAVLERTAALQGRIFG